MSSGTDFIIKLNSVEDANEVVSIMKSIAAKVTLDYPDEISKFITDIVVDGSTVKVYDSNSLMSSTFCSLIPQMMMEIARYNFGAITMEALHISYSGGYRAEFSGRVYKNRRFMMSFYECE